MPSALILAKAMAGDDEVMMVQGSAGDQGDMLPVAGFPTGRDRERLGLTTASTTTTDDSDLEMDYWRYHPTSFIDLSTPESLERDFYAWLKVG